MNTLRKQLRSKDIDRQTSCRSLTSCFIPVKFITPFIARDYWNLTSAGLTITGKIGDQDTLSADLTPR